MSLSSDVLYLEGIRCLILLHTSEYSSMMPGGNESEGGRGDCKVRRYKEMTGI